MASSSPRGAARRRSILDAALECFTEHGYAATTVGDILRRSGSSTGSLYHLFGSKEELAASLYIETIDEYQRGFLEILSDRDAESGIAEAVRYHIGWSVSNRERTRFLLFTRPSEILTAGRTDLERLNREFLDACWEWVQSQCDAGDLRRLPRDLYYPLWLGPAQEFVRLWVRGSVETRPSRAATQLAEAAWSSLRTSD